MPIPSRPETGETIASDWGQHVHDYAFAPAGVQASSSAARTMGAGNPSSYLKLHLDTVGSDPGGYLDAANDQVEIPADGGGLYSLMVRFRTDNGDDTDETNVRVRLNGTDIAIAQVGNEGATAVIDTIPWAGSLSAGDILTVFARQIGGGDRADVEILDLFLYRIGAELGAPTT